MTEPKVNREKNCEISVAVFDVSEGDAHGPRVCLRAAVGGSCKWNSPRGTTLTNVSKVKLTDQSCRNLNRF